MTQRVDHRLSPDVTVYLELIFIEGVSEVVEIEDLDAPEGSVTSGNGVDSVSGIQDAEGEPAILQFRTCNRNII